MKAKDGNRAQSARIAGCIMMRPLDVDKALTARTSSLSTNYRRLGSFTPEVYFLSSGSRGREVYWGYPHMEPSQSY